MQYRWILLVIAAAAVVPAMGGPVVNQASATSFGLVGGTISNTGTSRVIDGRMAFVQNDRLMLDRSVTNRGESA
jgi:hypothetical protein